MFHLFLPNNSEHKLSIDAAYELMWAWLRQSFPEKEIDAFEITTSYCPGTYDLSIGGQKVCRDCPTTRQRRYCCHDLHQR